MKKTFSIVLLICCFSFIKNDKKLIEFRIKEVTLIDKSRNRLIPIAYYMPKNKRQLINMPIVIFSHGYGKNKSKSNLAYGYLNENLVQNGYFVTSIQHELPTDELMPTTGIIQVVRKPFWERGAQNILYVLNELKLKYPMLNFKNVTIMGHSMGGDSSVLFAEKYPELVTKLITLDQRRKAFPRVNKPKIYSLRSSDQPADEGVIPSEEEQKDLGMTIIKLPNTTHNDMDENGTAEQHKEINDYIQQFLNN